MHQLPPHVARHREPILDQVLSHLPDELLSALAHGLDRHAGGLVAGRLYDRYDGGGCAVGVMLRELSPEAFRQGRLQFMVRRHRQRTILREPTGLHRSLVTRLSHVEMCFDRTAVTLAEHAAAPDLAAAANVTGRWMAERCRQRLHERNRSFFVPESWMARRVAPGLPPCALPVGEMVRDAGTVTPVRRMIGHDGTVMRVRRMIGHDGTVMPVQRMIGHDGTVMPVRRMIDHDGTVTPVKVSTECAPAYAETFAEAVASRRSPVLALAA